MTDRTELLAAVGRQIRVHRKRQGMTQENLAKRIGLTRSSVANIEAGRQGDIGIAFLTRTAVALGTDAATLLETAVAVFASVDGPGRWQELARRVTASERDRRAASDKAWRGGDVTAALRHRYIADGLLLAREHQLDVSIAETVPARRGEPDGAGRD